MEESRISNNGRKLYQLIERTYCRKKIFEENYTIAFAEIAPNALPFFAKIGTSLPATGRGERLFKDWMFAILVCLQERGVGPEGFRISFRNSGVHSTRETYTVKKRLAVFPSLAGMSLSKHSLAGNNLRSPSPRKVWLNQIQESRNSFFTVQDLNPVHQGGQTSANILVRLATLSNDKIRGKWNWEEFNCCYFSCK